MKKLSKIFLLTVFLTTAMSCDLDLLDNPNQLNPSSANPDFLLNSIQLDFGSFFITATQFGMDNTRMLAMFGNNYPNAYQATSFDGMWSTGYAGLLADIKALKERAAEDGLRYHAGVAKTLEAYVLVTLVDYFGDVPLSQFGDPTNFNPGVDPGAQVYNSALALYNEALADFGAVVASTRKPTQDLFYGGTTAKWITAINTMKLKLYMTRRLVDAAGSKAGIDALLAANNLIDATDGSEDFVFAYPANSFDNPNNYHPWFMGNYQNGAGQYMSNFYMNEMYNGKSVRDPRMRYYFYRQTLTIPTDVNVLNCVGATGAPAHFPDGMVFCSVGDGYFGRDHLDNAGIPPDGNIRTTYGVYPAGGKFDNSSGVPGTITDGLRGKGISPIMLASFTEFMKAEAVLTLSSPGDARASLEAGIRKSITKVLTFTPAGTQASFVPSAATITNYVNAVLNIYDNSSDKLDIVIKEYWIALFGNGIEAYNAYRRTSSPKGMQPALNINPGPYYRSFTYPAVFVNRNSSAVQKTTPAVKVFWDTNPATLN